MSRTQLFATAAFAIMALPVCAAPADNTDQDRFGDRLFGNMAGLRDTLGDKGVDLSLVYNGTLWGIGVGHKNGMAYSQNVELRADVDGTAAYGLKGNSISVAVQDTRGSHPNSMSGSTEGIDNLEADPGAFRLYEAYMQQTFLDEKLTALFGVRDLNVDFVWTEASANFIKPTFQIGQDLAQSGSNGPSIFPYTGLALTLKYASDDWYVVGGKFEGVPQDPDHPRSLRMDLQHEEGALFIAEGGYEANNGLNKLAVGAWTYTEDAPTIANAAREEDSRGAYLLSSYQFYKDCAAARDLTAFFRIGFANSDTLQTNWAYETGIVGNGWIAARPDAQIGLGMTQSHNGDDHRAANAPADNSEYGFELYYIDQITPAIAIQPDLQYVVNPGTDTTTDDAYIAGIRLNVNF